MKEVKDERKKGEGRSENDELVEGWVFSDRSRVNS